MFADFELITQAGSTILKRVQCNVLPGPMCEILLGVSELRALGVTPAKDLVHKAIRKRVMAAKAAKFVPIVDLEEIDGRLQDLRLKLHAVDAGSCRHRRRKDSRNAAATNAN